MNVWRAALRNPRAVLAEVVFSIMTIDIFFFSKKDASSKRWIIAIQSIDTACVFYCFLMEFILYADSNLQSQHIEPMP